MQHPVVAGCSSTVIALPPDACARVDRPLYGCSNRSALRLVSRGDSVLAKRLHDVGVGTVDVADCDVVHGELLPLAAKRRRLY